MEQTSKTKVEQGIVYEIFNEPEWYDVSVTVWYGGINAAPTSESWSVLALSQWDAMEQAKKHFAGWFAEIGYAYPAEVDSCKR